MSTKLEKLTREEWLRIGAETKLLDTMLNEYSLHLCNIMGKTNKFAKQAEKAFHQIRQLRSDLDDNVPNMPDADTVFYGQITPEQKKILEELGKSK